MTEDDAAYVRDLIHTARDHYGHAIALLDEAARIAGGETRDAPGELYRVTDRHHATPPHPDVSARLLITD